MRGWGECVSLIYMKSGKAIVISNYGQVRLKSVLGRR